MCSHLVLKVHQMCGFVITVQQNYSNYNVFPLRLDQITM